MDNERSVYLYVYLYTYDYASLFPTWHNALLIETE